MSEKIDLMKKKVELAKVQASKLEMEMRIAERLEDIERLEINIKAQEARINELKNEIK